MRLSWKLMAAMCLPLRCAPDTRAGLAAAREQGRVGGRRRVMTLEVVERAERMLDKGATRQQVADVIGVGVKTMYKYFPASTIGRGV